MRVACLLTLCSAVSYAQDAREIVVRSLARHNQNSQIARDFTFVERTEVRDLNDKSGKGGRSRTYEVRLLGGSPYRRLIARDDKPLPPDEDREEQRKLLDCIAQRRAETAEERARRIAEWEKKRREFRDPLAEIPKAFHLKLVGEETVNGVETWVIEANPRPGYKPGEGYAQFFPKIKCRFWISKTDYGCVKAGAEVLETISYGLILARVQKGSRLQFEQARVQGGVWVPMRVEATAALQFALLKHMHTGYEITYRDYRRFEVESHLVGFHEFTEPLR